MFLELNSIAIVASVAIVSLSTLTYKTVSLLLSSDINLSNKVKLENK